MKRSTIFGIRALLAGALLLPAQVSAVSLDAPNTSSYADTEAVTNVVFNAGDSDDRLFRISLELNATADNDVSILR